MASGTQPIQTN